MRNTYCRTRNMERNTELLEKWKIHIVWPELWRENWKTWKTRHKHCTTWNMARKLKIMKN